MKEKTMKSVLAWFGIVAIICFALIPIRVYILHSTNLAGFLSILGLVFIGVYFILNWKLKRKTEQQEKVRTGIERTKPM
jgi:arginine exporter protein ArgO